MSHFLEFPSLVWVLLAVERSCSVEIQPPALGRLKHSALQPKRGQEAGAGNWLIHELHLKKQWAIDRRTAGELEICSEVLCLLSKGCCSNAAGLTGMREGSTQGKLKVKLLSWNIFFHLYWHFKSFLFQAAKVTLLSNCLLDYLKFQLIVSPNWWAQH